MPGPVSDSYPGPADDSPYVPSWCYDDNNPPMCVCGHHDGYHNYLGECLQAYKCNCIGYEEKKMRTGETVTISKEEYDNLKERDKWLSYLEAAGVDNWDGWDYAVEMKCEDENK